MRTNGGEVECRDRGGVAGGDHHDGDFAKRRDAERDYEYGDSHGVVVLGCVGDRTMATAYVHGRVMPGGVDRR